MNEDYINILAIDPGSNIGVSIYTISVPDLVILNIETYFIDLSYFDKADPEVNRLRNKLISLESCITELINVYQPHILAIEDTFVNFRFPKSAVFLAQYIATVELTVSRLNPFITIYKYAPKYIKSGVGAGGTADKNVMMERVSAIPEITNFVDTRNKSEHEIDSLAIGYITIDMLRANPGILFTL
jgi:Holliday junction resolvasome RuvABC endonuclease subunit